MSTPFFFKEEINSNDSTFELDEVSSKHVVQVLRMKVGDQLQLTDGQGSLLTSELIGDHKKHCSVKVVEFVKKDRPKIHNTIAISLTKNNSRFEWFLEKATELGISEIIPLICHRTEKQHFRLDRMKNILVSAMLQSQQCWLPQLHEPTKFNNTCDRLADQKFIAHCIESEKRDLSDMINESLGSRIILIGPEGDFTKDEIQQAVDHHFIPVALGETRLRTETAGMVAATLLSLI
jgi:16S rRNA (uracil1498-N3)-methyltransferase